MEFFLGTNVPGWLSTVDVPLFLNHRKLYRRKSFPRALAFWGCDSGGYEELRLHGRWTFQALEYAAKVREYLREIGNLSFAVIQDWICHPAMIARTGLSLQEHQERTVQSFEDLLQADPDLPWLPVVQGWEPDDYLRCVDMYEKRGFSMAGRAVGVGTLAMRQDKAIAQKIISVLYERGLKMHAFGYKQKGLIKSGAFIATADSSSWSYEARKKKIKVCNGTHKVCASCPVYALRWRANMLAAVQKAMRSQLHLL